MLLYDCLDSPYDSWIANDQFWWTSSASNRYSDLITYADGMGHIANNSYYDSQGIRPTIVIAKNDLENLN